MAGKRLLPEFLWRQIPGGIGVDGAASNKRSNMSTEVKSIYVLQNSREVQRCTGPGEQLEAAALSPEDVLTLFLQRSWPRWTAWRCRGSCPRASCATA